MLVISMTEAEDVIIADGETPIVRLTLTRKLANERARVGFEASPRFNIRRVPADTVDISDAARRAARGAGR